MFLYACGVSRVHQRFELFEQILKIVLILKKSVVDSYFDDTRSQIRNVVSLSLFFLSCLPSTFFSSSLL